VRYDGVGFLDEEAVRGDPGQEWGGLQVLVIGSGSGGAGGLEKTMTTLRRAV